MILSPRPALHRCACFVVLSLLLLGTSATPVQAVGPYTWNGNTTGNWSLAGNWSGSAPPPGGGTAATDVINFAGTTGAAYNATLDLTGVFQLNALNINNTGGSGLF